MAFFRKLFAKMSEIDRLQAELKWESHKRYAEEQRADRAEAKLELTEKALGAERRAKDKIALRYCDQISRQQKLPERFVEDSKPEKEAIQYYDEAYEAQLRAYAIEAKQQAEANGDIEPWPLEKYIEDARGIGLDRLSIN